MNHEELLANPSSEMYQTDQLSAPLKGWIFHLDSKVVGCKAKRSKLTLQLIAPS